jgi:hypothetical protein
LRGGRLAAEDWLLEPGLAPLLLSFPVDPDGDSDIWFRAMEVGEGVETSMSDGLTAADESGADGASTMGCSTLTVII